MDSSVQISLIADALDECYGLIGDLPHHLCIESDNACSETKNQWTNKFAGLLTTRGKFASVSNLYAAVGHTHNRLDQRFSVLFSSLDRAQETLQSPQA